jgi:hypothetical protein
MIDTLAIRLHNLNKYEPLLKELELEQNKGYTLKTGKVEPEKLRQLRSAGYSPKQIITYLESSKKRVGDFIIKSQAMQRVNKSSHYAFTYGYDWIRDFVEFNFPCPNIYMVQMFCSLLNILGIAIINYGITVRSRRIWKKLHFI